MTDSGESKLPLQYEDGPDYCTVRDAQGRDFALTMQPDLMRAMEKALSSEIASFMSGPPAANPAFAIHDALTKANLEYSGYSCNGVNLFGDRKSINAAAAAFHSHSQIDWYQRNLRHWREECGKLHARLTIAVEALRSIHGRLWRDDEPYDERLGDLKSLALAALTAVANKEVGYMGDVSGTPFGPSDR